MKCIMYKYSFSTVFNICLLLILVACSENNTQKNKDLKQFSLLTPVQTGNQFTVIPIPLLQIQW